MRFDDKWIIIEKCDWSEYEISVINRGSLARLVC